ncbi:MAG: winged helix-turn-helix domain-containing protein, partial [Anaerolineales bacterium]|nr:winged helix-turn-helix domain-containing protein [Anaerolineales bacterium]
MIRLFNVWNVQIDGISFHIAGRKQVALLAYLALESGHRHSRQSLLGLLWPEMGEDEARNNLRVTLAGLRRVLRKG